MTRKASLKSSHSSFFKELANQPSKITVPRLCIFYKGECEGFLYWTPFIYGEDVGLSIRYVVSESLRGLKNYARHESSTVKKVFLIVNKGIMTIPFKSNNPLLMGIDALYWPENLLLPTFLSLFGMKPLGGPSDHAQLC